MKDARTIKLVVEYEGTNYQGWQSQGWGATVQDALEEAIVRLTGERPRVSAAGRTDAGVHALGQVAAFSTASRLDAATILRALNSILPGDIRIVSAHDAPEGFHPRHGARGKVYAYTIAVGPTVPVFIERFVWRVPGPLHLPSMREAAGRFIGRRDFRALMGAGSGVMDTVREIRSVEVGESGRIEFLGLELPGRYVRITVEGDGFLRHMVRNMVGTLVEVGRGRFAAHGIDAVLASSDRTLAGPTAPAKGLFLVSVRY